MCLGSSQRWWHLSKLMTWGGFIMNFFTSSWASSYFSPVSPESEVSIFELLYIERRNSPLECGVTLYFWLFGYFQGSSSGLKNQINSRSFPLISCTDTILGGDTSPRPVGEWTGCFHSCSRKNRLEHLRSHAPVIPY